MQLIDLSLCAWVDEPRTRVRQLELGRVLHICSPIGYRFPLSSVVYPVVGDIVAADNVQFMTGQEKLAQYSIED